MKRTLFILSLMLAGIAFAAVYPPQPIQNSFIRSYVAPSNGVYYATMYQNQELWTVDTNGNTTFHLLTTTNAAYFNTVVYLSDGWPAASFNDVTNIATYVATNAAQWVTAPQATNISLFVANSQIANLITNNIIFPLSLTVLGNITNDAYFGYNVYASNSVQTPFLWLQSPSSTIQNNGMYHGTNEVRLYSSADGVMRLRLKPDGTGQDGSTQPNIIAQGGGVLYLGGTTTTSNQVSMFEYQNFPYADVGGSISQGAGTAGRPGGFRIRLFNSTAAFVLETNGLWHFDSVGTNNSMVYFNGGLTVQPSQNFVNLGGSYSAITTTNGGYFTVASDNFVLETASTNTTMTLAGSVNQEIKFFNGGTGAESMRGNANGAWFYPANSATTNLPAGHGVTYHADSTGTNWYQTAGF